MPAEIIEKLPDFEKWPEWAQKAHDRGQLFHEFFKRIDLYKLALQDIQALALDHDGFATVEGLKGLVDDMSRIAGLALKLKSWTEKLED